MSNGEDTSNNTFQVQTDPDQTFAGVVVVKAYHAESKQTDHNARLYITVGGGLEVHMEEGVYPVRAAYDLFTNRTMRLESDDFDVIEQGEEEQPRLEYKAVFVHIPTPAFKAAIDFAKSISTPPTVGTFIPNEVSVWQLPIQNWGAVKIAERGEG